MGTPRIVADKTGSLVNTSRHDYLPFGAELYAGSGGRTIAQGYQGDNVRQHFTGYQRDNETGLDYAQARFYSSPQGRFTSFDPLMESAHAGNPQSWNRYAYVGNNPLNGIDPTGSADNHFEETPMPLPEHQAQQPIKQPPPSPYVAPPPLDSSLEGSPEYIEPAGARQVVDVNKDPAILNGIANIRGTPLPPGTAPS